jgi:hypothetical protein
MANSLRWKRVAGPFCLHNEWEECLVNVDFGCTGTARAEAVVVLGAQWGDEGKGKIVDVLSERFRAAAC